MEIIWEQKGVVERLDRQYKFISVKFDNIPYSIEPDIFDIQYNPDIIHQGMHVKYQIVKNSKGKIYSRLIKGKQWKSDYWKKKKLKELRDLCDSILEECK